MIIALASGGFANTNCYLIGDEATKKAVIFDAPDHTVSALLDKAQNRELDVIGLWLTHGHHDHIADHALVTERFANAKLLMHPLDEYLLQRPDDWVMPPPFPIRPRSADAHLEGGQQLSIGELSLHVIHTPGHSRGHVMFHFPRDEVLIGGDLIICGAVGRTDFPESDEAELFRSIAKVMKLPPATRLLPGHCDVSTLEHEARSNPYVREAMTAH